MLAYDYPLLGVFWTILEFFLLLLWILLLIFVFADIFRSADLSGLAKALWVIFVVVLPWLGVLIYLIARGGDMQARRRDLVSMEGPRPARPLSVHERALRHRTHGHGGRRHRASRPVRGQSSDEVRSLPLETAWSVTPQPADRGPDRLRAAVGFRPAAGTGGPWRYAPLIVAWAMAAPRRHSLRRVRLFPPRRTQREFSIISGDVASVLS